MTNVITPSTIAPAIAPKQAKAVKSKTVLKVKHVRAAIVFSNAKRTIKKAEERKKRAEAIIREGLGDAGIGTDPRTGMNVVEVMESSNSSYDANILKTRFPDAERAAKVTTPYTYLKTI